jgi:ABC-type hemin transport system substrate-binding protein
LMQRLGVLTGSEAAAHRLSAALVQALDHLETPPRRPRVFCPIWKNPWMSFNGETYADDMLWLAGGDNVCRPRAERYCSLDLQDIAAADPEAILLPDEPYVFAAKDLPALAPLSDTAAWRSGRVHFIDGKALSWYGPRTAPALHYLRAVLEGEEPRAARCE